MIKKVLEVINISKRYNDLVAVNNVSFSVYEGEIFGFIGPNGAGKSTVIKLITGLSRLDSGTILINNYSIKNNFKNLV